MMMMMSGFVEHVINSPETRVFGISFWYIHIFPLQMSSDSTVSQERPSAPLSLPNSLSTIPIPAPPSTSLLPLKPEHLRRWRSNSVLKLASRTLFTSLFTSLSLIVLPTPLL